MTIKVAINGFGRIGRNVLRAIMESGRKDIEVVAINDLGPVETNAHLFRFDSVHGRFNGEVKVAGDTIDVGRGPIKVTAIRNPAELPHKALGIDIATSIPAVRVVAFLERLIDQYGAPQAIRCDNGPELTSETFTHWCRSKDIELRFIQTGQA